MPIYVSKGGGGGGADADAIHDNVAGEISAIAEKTAPVAADMLLIEDSAAANAKKKMLLSSLPFDVSAATYLTATQSIANSTWTAVLFDAEYWDTDSLHDTTANQDRLRAPSPGKYLAIVYSAWADNSTGHRTIMVRDNTPTQTYIQRVSANLDTRIVCCGLFDLDTNDYVEVLVFQNSGGALNVLAVSSAALIKLAHS